MKQNLLTDDIPDLFRKLSPPAVIGLIAASTYQFIDLLFIGRWVGLDAISAVSLSYLPVLVINGFGALIGTGAASILSRAIGADEAGTRRNVYPTLLLLSLGFSAILMPLLLLSAEPVMRALSDSESIASLGTGYLGIIAFGIPFIVISTALSMAVRAEGMITTSVIMIGTGTLLNIALDPVFIKLAGLGLGGAATATVISQAAACAVCLGFTVGTGRLKQTAPGSRLIRPMLTIGLSGIMMNLMTLIQLAFVYRTIGRCGDHRDIAVLGTCMTFMNIAFVPLWGISQALQPVIGMNYGAGKILRVRRAFSIFTRRSLLISTGIWGLAELFPVRLLGWFITDGTTPLYGATAFRLIFGLFFAYGYLINSLTLFQATGKVAGAFVLMLCRMMIVFVPVLLLTTFLWNKNGIWAAFFITDSIIVTANIIILRTEKKESPETFEKSNIENATKRQG